MKRVITILILATIMCASAFAEEIDLSSMTVAQLQALRDRVDAELQSRNPPTDGDLIVDDDWYRVVLLSYQIEDLRDDSKMITLYCEWTNKRDEPFAITDWVAVDATSGRYDLSLRNTDMYKIVRAGSTHEFTITIVVPDWSDIAEVKFYSFWRPANVYKEYTISVR